MTASSSVPVRGVRRLFAEGLPRSLAIGAAFALAWSPCIGPILGVVLTLAAASGTAVQGAFLLVWYSLGLGLWFVAMGAGFTWLAPRLRRLGPYLPGLMVASGVIFILLGAAMFLGEFTRLNRAFQAAGFFFDSPSLEAGLTGGVQAWFGPGVAFLGGVISFLSPCVLPLVPAYLVSIAGEAVLAGAREGGVSSGERWHVIRHAFAFVLGFTMVFASVGASAGLVGQLAAAHLDLLTRIGGAVMIVLGMQMAGLIHIPYLERTYQLRA